MNRTKTKVLTYFLSFALLFGLLPAWTITAGAADTDWDGSSANIQWYVDDPSAASFTINSADDLAGLATLVDAGTGSVHYDDTGLVSEDGSHTISGTYFDGKTITLGTDLSLGTEKEWTPIGTYVYLSDTAPYDYSDAFQGTFDGGGHSITGLYINGLNNGAGLFGCVAANGTVKDLSVTNANIKDLSTDDSCYIGFVVGYLYGGSVEACHSSGTLQGQKWSELGGIAGDVDGGSVSGCDSSVTVSVNGFLVGGVAGKLLNNGQVNNCHATGTIYGKMAEGGVVGDVQDGSITNCYFTGDVSGAGNVGGVAGYAGSVKNNCVVESCYSTGTVSSTSAAGGVVGFLSESNSKVVNCYSTSTCHAGYTSSTGKKTSCYAGGVAGHIQCGSTVQNCYTTGAVSGASDYNYIGGVAGEVTGCSIINCAALNPGVSGTGSYISRVCGYAASGDSPDSSTNTFSGNYAFNAMTGGGSLQTADGLDGADITIQTIMSGTSFWKNTMAWDDSAWIIENGKLPILKNVGGDQSTIPAHLIAKSIATASVTGVEDKTYDGQAESTPVVVTLDSATLMKDTDYTLSVSADGDGTSAGVHAGTVTLTFTGIGNYTGTKTVQYTIGKVELALDTDKSVVSPKVFDGTSGAQITPVFTGLVNGDSLTFGTDYTISNAAFDSADAGSDKTVTAAIVLTDSATARNYVLQDGNFSKSGLSISKAPAPTILSPTVKICRGAASTGNTVDLTKLLPSDKGATNYAISGTNTLLENVSASSVGILTFDTQSADSAATENITVNADMQNYESAAITVKVNLTDKKVPVVTPSVRGSLTYGQTLASLPLSATATEDTAVVSGSISWDNLDSKPSVSEASPQSWTFTPKDPGNYESVTGFSSITVYKADPQGTPTITKISADGNTLSDTAITCSFLNLYDGSAVPGTLIWDLPDTTVVTQGTSYCWTFTPDDIENYTVRTGSLTPYPHNTGGGSTSPTYQATVTGSDGSSMKLSVTIAGNSTVAAIGTAQTKLLTSGRTLSLTMPAVTGTDAYGIRLPANNLSSDADSTLTMNTALGNISVPTNMLSSLSHTENQTAQITISRGNSSFLPSELRSQIGSRPIVQLALSLGGSQTEWSNPDAPVTVSIPYTPTKEEKANPSGIVVWYIDGSGVPVCVPSGYYDAETGTVTFKTTHFSQYSVAYNTVSFSDVPDSAWYQDYVSYLAARDIIGGTGNRQFSPNANITRAQFVTILSRVSGDDLSGYTSSSFTDVAAADWYFKAVEWAYKKGIATGTDGKFNPNTNITRQDIAVMIARYADKAANYTLPETNGAVTFKDSTDISSYASEAVTAMQRAGIISGNSDGNFAPTASATRAQAATMIARLLQGMIGD